MDVSTSNSVPVTTKLTRRRLDSVAGNWPIGVKVAASVVLIAAPVAQLVDRAMFDMSNGYTSLFRELSANPSAVHIGAIAGMFAPALLIGSVFVWFQLARTRSRIAASISLIAGVLAFTCLAVTTGYSFAALGLSDAHLGTQAVADALAGYSGPPAPVLFATFTITSVVCILAAAWGLWRAHAVSRASVILLVLFIVADVVEVLPFDPHFIGLAATILMSVSILTPVSRRNAAAATTIKP